MTHPATDDPAVVALRAAHDLIPDPTDDQRQHALAALRGAIASEAHVPPAAQRSVVARRAPRAPRRGRVLGLVGAGLAVAAIVVATTTGLGGTVDVVARAEAALAEGGPVVHLVTEGGSIGADGAPMSDRERGPGGERGTLEPRLESWSTAAPLRMLTRQRLLSSSGELLGVRENGYAADGSSWERTPTGRVIAETPERTRQTLVGGPETLARNVNSGIGVDPTASIRKGLAAGEYRDDGPADLRGRDARRLVADDVAPDGTARRTEYLVDAETYAPLRVAVTHPGTATPTTPAVTITIVRYERLPLSATGRLFEVPENPDAGTASKRRR